MEETKKWPGQVDEAHPEVFTTIPPQGKERKPGQFTPEQLKQYFEQGYVVVEDFFNCEEELQPVRDSIKVLVDGLAQKLYDAGKITKLHKNHGLFQRLAKIEDDFPGSNILLPKSLGSLTPEFRTLWSNERLLNLMEQILGTKEIIGHPVWNLRTKTPKNEATTVPWHQDVGYLDNDSYDVLQPTAWIPLLDTDELNGCMQMVKGGHRTGKVATHQCCHGGTWYVMLEEDEMEKTLEVDMSKDIVTCPVPYGGALFFNNMIPHRSLNNISKDVRWSLDLRWQRADQKVGFYGLKEGLKLRSADPNFEINWDPFDLVDRNVKQAEYLEKTEEDFDTSIAGPWMKKWEIVHVNRHTDSLESDDATTWHAQVHRP